MVQLLNWIKYSVAYRKSSVMDVLKEFIIILIIGLHPPVPAVDIVCDGDINS